MNKEKLIVISIVLVFLLIINTDISKIKDFCYSYSPDCKDNFGLSNLTLDKTWISINKTHMLREHEINITYSTNITINESILNMTLEERRLSYMTIICHIDIPKDVYDFCYLNLELCVTENGSEVYWFCKKEGEE